MPVCAYQCQLCDARFEKLVFAGDKVAVLCPQCRSTKVRQRISCDSFMKIAGIGKCASDGPKGFTCAG